MTDSTASSLIGRALPRPGAKTTPHKAMRLPPKKKKRKAPVTVDGQKLKEPAGIPFTASAGEQLSISLDAGHTVEIILTSNNTSIDVRLKAYASHPVYQGDDQQE